MLITPAVIVVYHKLGYQIELLQESDISPNQCYSRTVNHNGDITLPF